MRNARATAFSIALSGTSILGLTFALASSDFDSFDVVGAMASDLAAQDQIEAGVLHGSVDYQTVVHDGEAGCQDDQATEVIETIRIALETAAAHNDWLAHNFDQEWLKNILAAEKAVERELHALEQQVARAEREAVKSLNANKYVRVRAMNQLRAVENELRRLDHVRNKLTREAKKVSHPKQVQQVVAD